MPEEFLLRAALAGVGVALVAGPLGCFVVWRRLAYFGDTMAHSALLGVTLGLALGLSTQLSVLVVTLAVAVLLSLLERLRAIPSDTLLGILSHASLSIGLVAVGFMAWLRVDLMAYLFGDVLSVSWSDVAVVYGGGAAVLACLAWLWRDLIAATVSPDLAQAEGVDVVRARIAFTLLMAAVIAIAMKIVGVLLITSLLIIPAATARRFVRSPEAMAVVAAVAGVLAVLGGLAGSVLADTPSGPSIVVAALVLFLAALLPLGRLAAQR
jgi:zinc transport system permease protein